MSCPRFDDIVTEALVQNLALQSRFKETRSYHSSYSWLKEFGTIRLGFGRMTGKTRTIAEFASDGDLVITHSWEAAKEFARIASYSPVVASVPKSDNQMTRLRGFVFDTIWVDDASLILNDENLERVYEIAVYCKAEQIVLIG